jgi:glycerol-3-phosphate acyltransferase PlsY
VEIAISLVVAYLLGSLPTAYLAGRLTKGVDIRKLGSGSVGGSNVATVVSRWLVFPVGIVDVGKGMLAVLLAKWLDVDLTWQVAAGLLAIVGHNWPIFLGFIGGRGIGTSIGVMLVLFPLALTVLVPLFGLIFLLSNAPLAFLSCFTALPFISWGMEKPIAVTLGFIGVFLILVTKRLLGNKGKAESNEGWRRILLYRLFLDRDVRDKNNWIRRQVTQAELSEPQDSHEIGRKTT